MNRELLQEFIDVVTQYFGKPKDPKDLLDGLIQLGILKVDYYEYIKSAEWKEKSDAAKERAGYRCQVCNSPDNLNTHHRTYANLGHEPPEDLFVLCHDCHELFSKNGKLAK